MTSFYSWRLMFLTFFGKPRGDKHTHDHAHESPMVMLIPLGVLIFAGTGVAGLLLGENYLNYSPLGSHPESGQHLGILIVEAGVFITVTSTMLAIFYGFGGLADEADAEQVQECEE